MSDPLDDYYRNPGPIDGMIETTGNPFELAGDDGVRKVTVCSACKQASCWQGKFFCDDYQNAGTVEKTVAELRALNLENECYWRQEE